MTSISAPFGVVPTSVGVLEPYVAAGVFGSAEVHLAATVARLAQRAGHDAVDDLVLLGLAVAARAPRSGHVCVELDDVHRFVVDRRITDPDGAVAALRWPDPQLWAAALQAADVVADPESAAVAPLRPLVWDGRRLYLQRLWVDEQRVAAELRRRAVASSTSTDPGGLGALDTALRAVFATSADDDLQHRAARRSLEGRLGVIVGGPGTGKTRTVARLLAASLLVEPRLQLALAAPTGKAAARMTEAVQSAVEQLAADGAVPDHVLDRLRGVEARTVHRLLGRGQGTRFAHDHRSPLPFDLVVIDETSMVDLPLMARLLDALRPDARLVLVGDPDQLASVEAGTVLADLVATDAAGIRSVLADRVVELAVAHRFAAGSGIAELAAAVRRGDADDVVQLLGEGRADVRWVRPDEPGELDELSSRVVATAALVTDAARAGRALEALAASRSLKVLAATRFGPLGLYDWSERIEEGVAASAPDVRGGRRWEVGRPMMVTRNDPVARVANGDTGVVVDDGGRLVLAVDTGALEPLRVPVARLDQAEPWWAMTIHKSQGSEFDEAVVSLPTEDSPVLTRELLYTAITRARHCVTVVADEATVRRAVQRPVARASGLRDLLN